MFIVKTTANAYQMKNCFVNKCTTLKQCQSKLRHLKKKYIINIRINYIPINT